MFQLYNASLIEHGPSSTIPHLLCITSRAAIDHHIYHSTEQLVAYSGGTISSIYHQSFILALKNDMEECPKLVMSGCRGIDDLRQQSVSSSLVSDPSKLVRSTSWYTLDACFHVQPLRGEYVLSE